MALTRRTFLATSTVALAAGTLGRIAWPPVAMSAQAQQQAPPTPEVKAIRRNVGTFTMQGGTIGWLVNDAGAVAVDSQFPNPAQVCVDDLLKRSGKTEIAMLINTHHHGDHTGGNGVFRPKTKTIVGHENVPKYMLATHKATRDRRAQQNPPPTTPAPAEPTLPDTTFAETWSSAFGDEQIRSRHYGPAHTGGDIVILFEKANVAHMGDLMFNRAHPVIDRTNGASIAGWIKTLRSVSSELPADTIYIFGHAAQGRDVTGARADLLHHANYLEALLAFVGAKITAGLTREQVLAIRDVIPGFDDYGPLVARPLPAAFDEITAGGRP
ncbi:MAG TPA: MBL fold metallo-hydrolase [Vicinamibacterales bacterium]|nr:MBL fold metallo-hydrolase [Vicinamibacterales bacterium]